MTIKTLEEMVSGVEDPDKFLLPKRCFLSRSKLCDAPPEARIHTTHMFIHVCNPHVERVTKTLPYFVVTPLKPGATHADPAELEAEEKELQRQIREKKS